MSSNKLSRIEYPESLEPYRPLINGAAIVIGVIAAVSIFGIWGGLILLGVGLYLRHRSKS